MGYFPFFTDIKDKPFVIVGGGRVALRKIEKLIPFEPKITVVSPEICGEISVMDGIDIIQRAFIDSDINGAFAVISASDNEKLNSHIYELCISRNILVNTVDDIDKCGFVFPAIVHKKNISVGISTSGKSPLFARYVRERIEDILDERCIETGDILAAYRPVIKEMFPDEKQRKNAAEALLKRCISGEKLPDENEICAILEGLCRED